MGRAAPCLFSLDHHPFVSISFLVSLPLYFLASLPLPVASPQTLYHSTL